MKAWLLALGNEAESLRAALSSDPRDGNDGSRLTFSWGEEQLNLNTNTSAGHL